jgi:phosphonoacetaldehyde hydrolase
LNALSAEERAARHKRAAEKLAAAGAHYVIKAVANMLPIIDDINARLARGERP